MEVKHKPIFLSFHPIKEKQDRLALFTLHHRRDDGVGVMLFFFAMTVVNPDHD